ncbi:class I SAM-dependent methyltransferase [Bacteroides stercorirosoris]|jgi:ubiquinone/menaquinone biosynthesis C-methylase UbiE|nr:class I SAM-dependent methyltransferase [Bacteroides stercorirosoris]
MSKEDMLITEFDFTLIANYFSALDRQGPGGKAETLKALSFITDLPAKPKIADLGCGTGFQTSVLASSMDCSIIAMDLLPEMVEGVKARIKRDKLEDKVTALVGSMTELPFRPNEFDVFWAEGSIYNIGFEKGLTEWKKFIKPGGYVAVSECCWLTNKRPDDMDYFLQNFPEIDNVSGKLRIMEQAGYLPVAHFVLPEYCWVVNYYAQMETRMRDFLEENNNSMAAQKFVDLMKKDILVYERYKEYFGYVFFIGQKCD